MTERAHADCDGDREGAATEEIAGSHTAFIAQPVAVAAFIRAFGRYHDEVWGTRTHEESAMFEALTLGVFEVGLSWSIVFGKRAAFRRAFREFDVAKVAKMTGKDVECLLEDASIIRNRSKIEATIDNARAMAAASPTLPALAKSYENNRKRAPRSIASLPNSTPKAAAFAKQRPRWPAGQSSI